LKHPQPTLRGIPQGRQVAELLQRTWMQAQTSTQGRSTPLQAATADANQVWAGQQGHAA
jgi:hypothetical protein